MHFSLLQLGYRFCHTHEIVSSSTGICNLYSKCVLPLIFVTSLSLLQAKHPWHSLFYLTCLSLSLSPSHKRAHMHSRSDITAKGKRIERKENHTHNTVVTMLCHQRKSGSQSWQRFQTTETDWWTGNELITMVPRCQRPADEDTWSPDEELMAAAKIITWRAQLSDVDTMRSACRAEGVHHSLKCTVWRHCGAKVWMEISEDTWRRRWQWLQSSCDKSIFVSSLAWVLSDCSAGWLSLPALWWTLYSPSGSLTVCSSPSLSFIEVELHFRL